MTGTSGVIIGGRAAARIGDVTGCGAIITSGSTSQFDGAGIARMGDTTSHGGTLVEGDSGWLIE